MRVSMFWSLSIVAPICLTLDAAGASGQPFDHANPPRMITVEHAEILMPAADGSSTTAFLIIWNGTETQTSLASVKSDAFASATIMRTLFTSGENTTEPISGPLPIPGHAELQMRKDGIHLILADPRTVITKSNGTRLTLLFDNGREMEVSTTVVPASEMLTRHRHGDGDRAAN